MRNDCIDENLTEAQRARFRTCWVLLAEAARGRQQFTLRPYLYEQFFAPDSQQRAVPMILEILSMMTDGQPVLIHFQCATPDHPDAPLLAGCAEAFGLVVRDAGSPSFLLYPGSCLPLDLLSAMLFDPDSAFHVLCYVPQRILLSKLAAMPYGACLWYLSHGLSRLRMDYLSGRPMLELEATADMTPERLMTRITPLFWRHGCRLVLRKV